MTLLALTRAGADPAGTDPAALIRAGTDPAALIRAGAYTLAVRVPDLRPRKIVKSQVKKLLPPIGGNTYASYMSLG
ncbi:MAG: hypothetical protein WAK82_33030 [Streptosporangiaceae bacterium]